LSRLSLTSKFLSCPEIQHAVECDEQGLCFSHFFIRAIFFKQDVLQIPFALLPKLAGMESTVKAAMLKSPHVLGPAATATAPAPTRGLRRVQSGSFISIEAPLKGSAAVFDHLQQPMGPQCLTPGAGQAPSQPPPLRYSSLPWCVDRRTLAPHVTHRLYDIGCWSE
jgi:hypothetical protein